MPSMVFEPAIPAKERPQTYALERTATWIGRIKNILHNTCSFIFVPCASVYYYPMDAKLDALYGSIILHTHCRPRCTVRPFISLHAAGLGTMYFCECI